MTPTAGLDGTLTAVPGLSVGHWTDPDARTGCTVVLCPPEGCVASGMVLGHAPGSRESALLEPTKTVDRVHAVVLAGGSAFGLAAACGVVRYLDERGIGFVTPFARVPIVPAAVIYDLGVGSPTVRPGEAQGYAAAEAATAAPVELGRVGVGAGATVSKYLGFDQAVDSGLGSVAIRLHDATIAALAVSNAVGDIVDPATGAVVAGNALPDALELADLFAGAAPGTNTTLVVVATDAPLDKRAAHQLAQSAHVGIARVTRPSHTLHDGDTSFVLSTGQGPEVPVTALTVAVQTAVAEAILAAARAAA